MEEVERQKRRLQQQRAIDNDKPNTKEEPEEKIKLEPFSMMVGRLETNQRQRLRFKKEGGATADKEVDHEAEDVRRHNKLQANQVPPPGMYNPKLVLRHVKVPIYRIPYSTKSRAASAYSSVRPREPLSSDDLNFNPDKLHRPVTGYVTLATKTSRRPITEDEIVDPEGKQFEARDIPRVSSRYR